ncbi:MAG TPA: sensor histidine kinase [Ktedonobacteraceae bacterium]|nr:sensor histidine kinase [Ktedonobacteraceae bacterium]
MNEFEHFRLLRWLLLLWVGLVSFWGIVGISSSAGTVWSVAPSVTCIKPIIHLTAPDLLQKGAFLLLMGAHGALLWLGLSGLIPRRLYWLYFPVQGILVLVASVLLHQVNVAFNLYLALTLGSIVMLQHVRAVIGVASGYLLLILFLGLLSFTPWYNWKSPVPGLSPITLLLNIWNTSDYMALLLFIVGYLMLYTQQARSHTELANTHQQLASAHDQLKHFARRTEELSRLTERQRLARDLHDTLAQGIVGIMMQIQVAHSQLGQRSYERAQQVMWQALKTSHEILTSARRAIDDLRAPFSSNEDFVKAFEEEIQRFATTTGILCATEGLDFLSLLPGTFHEHILRIVSEALNNIARHAEATHIWITGEPQKGLFLLQIRDDGRGFVPEAVEVQNGHYGLLGLRERARLLGGTFELESVPGQGTRLRFFVPSLEEIRSEQ